MKKTYESPIIQIELFNLEDPEIVASMYSGGNTEIDPWGFIETDQNGYAIF